MKTIASFTCENATITMFQDFHDIIVLTHTRNPKKTITDTFSTLNQDTANEVFKTHISEAIDTQMF